MQKTASTEGSTSKISLKGINAFLIDDPFVDVIAAIEDGQTCRWGVKAEVLEVGWKQCG